MNIEDFLKKYGNVGNTMSMKADLESVVDYRIKTTPLKWVLPMNERVYNVLVSKGIVTVEDLSMITEEQYTNLAYMGRKKVNKAKEILNKFGLTFSNQ